MKNSVKVFLACFLGALIGGAIALQFTTSFSFVAVIVGAVIGYFGYQFEDVVRAIPVAFDRATSWRPNTNKIKLSAHFVFYNNLSFSSLGIIFSVLLTGIVYLVGNSEDSRYPVSLLETVYAFIGVFIFCSIIFNSIILSSIIWGEFARDYKESRRRLLREMIETKNFAIVVNPIGLCNMMVVAVCDCTKYVSTEIKQTHPLQRTKKIGKGIGVFFWSLFKQIHASERLLCMTDAAIGAAVGLYYGNAIIGAVVGGVWGLINYEIVSKRIMHLIPETE